MDTTIRTETVKCNLCGANDTSAFCTALDRLHGIEGQYTYVRCNACSLIYMNPQVATEDIAKLYPTDYAPHRTAATEKDTADNRPAPTSLKTRLTLIPLLHGLLHWLLNVKIIRHVARTLTSQSRVLDVGCGSGEFLRNTRQQFNCTVNGLDISPNAVQHAKHAFDIDVFEGTLPQAPFPDASFDLITAWWYLEHEPDPNTALTHIARLLKDNAFCAIGIPNHHGLWARLFKRHWYHLDCPRHLCLYTPAAITTLLNRHGLTVTAILHDKTPWGLIGSLRYRFTKPDPAAHAGNPRPSLLLWALLLPLTICVSLLRMSDIMVVYAQKKPRTDSSD